jgi:hypothetical protein
MNSNSESFDQPTQVGNTGGKKMTGKQRAAIFAGLGGAAAFAGASAVAWGMSQDGEVNDNHPKPATDGHGKIEPPKPGNETPSDSTKVTPAPHAEVAPNAKPTPPKTDSHEIPNSHEPMVATHVTDEMSFEDAFKTARQEVGPGGYFEWNDHLYNTYYKEEWEAMSKEEREEYVNNLPNEEAPSTDPNSPHYSPAGYDASKPDIKVGEYNGHTVALGDVDHDGDSEVIVVDGTMGAIDKNNDGIMETRVEFDPTTHEVISQTPLETTFEAPKMSALNPSNVDSANEIINDRQVDVHIADSDGHHIISGDTDHDGDAEIVIVDNTTGAVDLDNDGILETRIEIDPETHQAVSATPMTVAYNAPAVNAYDKPQDQNVPTSNETNSDVAVITVNHDGHDVRMGDANHDGYVDILVLDNGSAVVDTDGDHQFDSSFQVDMTTGEVVATGPLEHPIEAPAMDSFGAEENTVASNDFNNDADVSDWVA